MGSLNANAVVYDAADKASITLGGTGGTTIKNVKAGAVTADSTEAINGKQLYDSNAALAAALGGGSVVDADGNVTSPMYEIYQVSNNGSSQKITVNNVGGAVTTLSDSVNSLQNQINNSSIGLVKQDPATNVISIGQNTGGTEINVAGSEGPRVISGVAAGKAPTDAVNVQQAQEMISGATTALRGEIRRNEKRADAGTAAATAVATLGQAYQPGQSAFSMGGGTWRGETGYAMGVSTVSENGKWLLKGAVNGSGRGGAGGGASVTYLW